MASVKALAGQDFIDAVQAADGRHQILRRQPALLHAELIRAAVLTGARETAARSAAAPLRRVVDVIEVPDRREAIIRAVRLARASGAPHPVVLVAGKGHEQGQEVAGVVHPFDDRSVVRQALLDELSPARPGGQ